MSIALSEGADHIPKTIHKVRAPATPTTSRTRDLEWGCAAVMIAISLVMALPGDSLAAPLFVEFHLHGMTEPLWAFVFGAVGGARIVALYVNGRSPRSPLAREIGAGFGFVAWGKMALMLHNGSYETVGAESISVGVYLVLMGIEALSIYRAAYDARYTPGR